MLFVACKEDQISTRDQELLSLSKQYLEIVQIAQDLPCESDEEWTYTAVGSKACGGPVGYLAYSTEIDTVAFLKMVEDYTKAQKAYNTKYGIISDCSVPTQPTGVFCSEGKPIFDYN